MKKTLLLSAAALIALLGTASAQDRGHDDGHPGGGGAPHASGGPRGGGAPHAAPAPRAAPAPQAAPAASPARNDHANSGHAGFNRGGNDNHAAPNSNFFTRNGVVGNAAPNANNGANNRANNGARNDNHAQRGNNPPQRADNHRPGNNGSAFNGNRGGNNNRGSVNYSQYHRNFTASRRFHAPAYRRPSGWYAHRWTFGERLPPAFFISNYWLNDFDDYDLPPPLPGTVWVRDGSDALLVDRITGEIVEVEYDIFY